MKKENITGLIVYFVILALAVLFGLVVLKTYFDTTGAMTGWQFALFILGAVATGAVFNAILFELCHMLGAKIGGYNIVSVSVFGFTFYKVNGKTKFRFASYDGLTGETKITPKNNTKKEPNPTMYLLLGTIVYAIEIVGAIFAFTIIKSMNENLEAGEVALLDTKWAFFILTAAIVGAMILLYNIIPLHLDSMTDGYRLRQVSGAKNRKAFNNLLRMENGEAIVDENGEAEEIHEASAFSTDIKLNNLYEMLNTRDYAGARDILDKDILSNEKVSKNVYLRARAQKIYVTIMMDTLEQAMEFYENEVSLAERREISGDVSMDCIRAYVLMSGLLDKSRSECTLAMKKLYKAYKGVPDARKKLERELFNEGLKKVIEVHPTWELEQYLMKDPEEK